jgi:uncharacterized protein (DUF302 family)
MNTPGLTLLQSRHGAADTLARLSAEIKSRGLTLFAHIDHAAGAREAGLPLRPTDLLLFGNARGGTPLMQAQQSIGIDLPLKALIFEDDAGTTWLGYNDPHWLASRHGLGAEVEPVLANLSKLLEALARAATAA